MNLDIEKILVSEEAIVQRCKVLAKQISEDYEDKKPILICPLKGAVSFFAHLCEQMTIPMVYDFIKASSYAGTQSTGIVNISYMPTTPLKDRHVIIVEDIIDTGRTLSAVVEELKKEGPASIELACLLDKPSMRKVPLEAKYTGFVIPNEFVVGFGLDYNEEYRNLPYVGVLKPEVYTK
ncbi:MAG: hypoxanthine phosphoribosyltransferase [Bacilli bacterium]|nr:hypoxanthine phosphoribosyltransferase [Bacilli bacterium]